MTTIRSIAILISTCVLFHGVQAGEVSSIASNSKYPLPDQYQIMVENSGYFPESLWLDTEKQVYRELLKETRANVLVVPFQVQKYAVDRVGRSLMTQHLAELIASSTEQKVADPILVARALGERSRAVNKNEVYWLANEMQVDTIIWGYVGHERDEALLLTLQVQQRLDKESFGDKTPLTQMNWKNKSFTDVFLPFDAFVSLENEIKNFLPISIKKRRKLRKQKRLRRLELPKSSTAMYSEESDNPIEAAYKYQMLGLLVPARMTMARERFFIRSLVLLQHISPKSPDYKTIKSRAYFYLNRRPAALAALKKAVSSEDKALLAALNGDIFELELQIASIKLPLLKLLSQVEYYDLKWAYEFGENDGDKVQEIASSSPEWQELIARRLVDGYVWTRQSNIWIKKILDKDMPIKGATAEDILASVIAIGDGKKEAEEISFSVYEHVNALIRDEGDQWCCNQLGYGPTKREYLYLLEAIGEDNLIRNVDFELNVQGAPERALTLLEQYETVYGGNPMLSQLHSEALIMLSKKKQGIAKKRMRKNAEVLAYDAYYLAGGQEAFMLKASLLLLKEKKIVYPFYNSDYPRRWFWHTRIKDGDRRFGDGNNLKDQILGNYKLSVQYSNNQFIKVAELYKFRLESGMNDSEAISFIDKYKDRFKGHPERVAYIASLYFKDMNIDKAKEILENGIKEEPLNWKNYYILGGMYVKDGENKEASNLFLKYPPFSDLVNKNRVSLSNDAYKAGSLLASYDAHEEAMPLFKISADYKTGSSASLESAEFVAKYEGNYGEAARYAAMRAKRYNDVKAYVNLMEYMYVFGYYDLAEAIFKSIVKRFPGVKVWRAAILGQRVKGKSDNEIMGWFKDSPYREGLSTENIVAHILELYINDRDIRADLPEIIEQIIKTPDIRLDLPGLVEIYDDKTGQWIVVGPSEYSEQKKWNLLTIDMTPKSDLVYFVEGYNAIKSTDYVGAEKIFANYLHYYNDKLKRFKYVLPYVTWSSVKAGDLDLIKNHLGSFNKDQQDYYYYISMGLIAGSEGRHADAVFYIKKAEKDAVKVSGPVSRGYQLFEIYEWLYIDSGEELYRTNIINKAKQSRKAFPLNSLYYAIEALYSEEKEDKIQALAIAMYLDEGSVRVNSFSDEDKKIARAWLKKNNPFILTRLGKNEIEI